MLVYVACMLKTPISLVYKGISSEFRVCCAGIVNSNFRNVGFALQYLWFQAPISMVLDSKTYAFRPQYL